MQYKILYQQSLPSVTYTTLAKSQKPGHKIQYSDLKYGCVGHVTIQIPD